VQLQLQIRALQMGGEYLFAIQKIRKLKPPKGKNARAADFQIIRFFLPCQHPQISY